MENKFPEFESVLENLNELGKIASLVHSPSVKDTQRFQMLQTALNLLGDKIDKLKDDYDNISYREGHFMATGSYEN